jgi:hypothetical protein
MRNSLPNQKESVNTKILLTDPFMSRRRDECSQRDSGSAIFITAKLKKNTALNIPASYCFLQLQPNPPVLTQTISRPNNFLGRIDSFKIRG